MTSELSWTSKIWKSSLLKMASVTAAILIGAALVATPAQAMGGRGGGSWHGGGGSWHGGGGSWHGAGMRVGAWHGAAWRGAAWRGAAWRGAAWHGRFFPHRRFAFFHHRRFFGGPFVGLYASGYSSCWSWVPTSFGWRRIWVCGSPYGWY